jgi:hypothetical protein
MMLDVFELFISASVIFLEKKSPRSIRHGAARMALITACFVAAVVRQVIFHL